MLEKWTRINYQPCFPLGDNNSKITACDRHIQLSRKGAQEGTVLLKNDNNLLPLKKGTRVAIFGKAQIDYIKVGRGSGDVFSPYTRNIYEGLKLKNYHVQIFDKLSLYYKDIVMNCDNVLTLDEPEISECLLNEAKAFADTAIITLNRISEEGFDRKNDETDSYYYLSKNEKDMIDTVSNNFKNVIVLLNTGAIIDTSWFADNDKIQSALLIWQGGMEGGLATADILVGEVNPSGKLVDTVAKTFNDYPSSETFHESDDYVKYTEDIFVGYRYFETIPNKKDCVVYPFGYGLSYTTFELSQAFGFSVNNNILISINVKNTGNHAGKEVVQIYFQPPTGSISKPAMNLCAFAKTRLLSPGEEEMLTLSFNIDDMASYDDLGDIQKSAYILEKGTYKFHIGTSIRNTIKLEYEYTLSENIIVKQLTSYCVPERLGKRLISDGAYISVDDCVAKRKTFPVQYDCKSQIPTQDEDVKKLIDVYNGEVYLNDFISQLTDKEMINLLHGQPNTGVAATRGMGNLSKYGIPNAMTVDGPAGVRTYFSTGIRTTAFPIATMLACTWNLSLVEEIGSAAALEVKENNLAIWLAPALNIHRSPLCGRNYEYYSEDPFITGKMASAMVKGIQKQNIAATPKHFACNNKETNRMESDSIVSERALREIYLRGFEICVKEANPKLIMTSYNLLNGIRTSENTELITGILRGEWGYNGLVVSDWWNHASHFAEIIAGNDVRMPDTSTTDAEEKYVQGLLSRNQLAVSVKRLLELLLWFE